MWGKIKDVSGLKAKSVEDASFVGVTDNGSLYVYDFTKNAAKKITVEQAMEILNVDADTVALIIESKGEYVQPLEIFGNDLPDAEDLPDDFDQEPEPEEEEIEEEAQEPLTPYEQAMLEVSQVLKKYF